MACRFTTHVCSRQASEFAVEEWYELVERLSPAVAGGDEQLRHPRRLGRALIHRLASRISESGAHRKEEGSPSLTTQCDRSIIPDNSADPQNCTESPYARVEARDRWSVE
jgi:hypothetical protein